MSYDEKIEDTREFIRNHNSRNRQYNDQQNKKTNNVRQNTTEKTKD